jgi:exoribonuclease-2
MIAANVAATRYLKNRNHPTLRRVVKIPKRWNRIMDLAESLGEKLPSQPNPQALRQFLLGLIPLDSLIQGDHHSSKVSRELYPISTFLQREAL